MKKKPVVPVSRLKLVALDGGGHAEARPANLKEAAYRQLKEDIVLGRRPFGAVLSPRKLGQEMGMSFLPVADALGILETEGLVETRDRAGTRVRVPTAEDIAGIYILREALESQAARLCAQQVTPAQTKELKARARQVDRMYAQCQRESGSRDLWVETSVFHANFHRFIAECAGCPTLTKAIDRSQVLSFKLLFDSAVRTKKRPPRWHQSLVDVITSGDPRAADAAAREHISYGAADVLRCLDTLRLENRWRNAEAGNA